MFSRYEDYLSQPFTLNFWSDEGICAACGILRDFSGDDWDALASRWRSRTEVWRVRCAETIDSHPSLLVMQILLDMLEEDDDDVVIAAADSLRSLAQAESNIRPETLQRIVVLRDHSGTAVKAALSDLIDRVTR